MAASIDYYAVLGLLPTAQNFLIRAAYKALAQRYHPDRFEGSTDEANRRMVEMNEAYAILSDSTARAKYDKAREKTPDSSYHFENEARTGAPAGNDPLENDWNIVAEYYPDIREIEDRLSRFSWRLAFAYRIYLLEAKAFIRRAEVAATMEQEFLQVYFGSDIEILEFARKIIECGHKSAAKALNNAIRVLGPEADSSRIVKRVVMEFGLSNVFESTKSCPRCGGELYRLADYCIHCHGRIK